MARYLDVHPDNPQPRSIGQVTTMLRDGALIAYPTDSGYSLGCRMDYHDGAARVGTVFELFDRAVVL